MAASASDKARKSYSYLQKTLSVQISDTDTTLTPNNVTNIPTDTGVSFVIDRVDSSGTKTPTKRELMTGKISGGTLTNLIRGEQGTTAQLHSANAVIEFVNSGEMWNDLIDFMLQDHSNPNGNHKTLTDDNGNEWLERGSVASAVNQVKITNAITATAPAVAAAGDDTNVDLRINAKGTGKIDIRGTNSLIDFYNPQHYAKTSMFDHVSSGGVWSGDAYASTRNASMTAMVCYINGRYISIAAVTARSFTASKDTYIDVLDGADGTGTLVYTEVANNAASPALAANSIRIGIIVTGASNIAAAGSVNQGQETMVLPIVSSIPYAVTDSIGNLICPRDPGRRILGYQQILTTPTSATAGSPVDVVGLTMTILVPAGRKVKIRGFAPNVNSTEAGGNIVSLYIRESSTIIATSSFINPNANYFEQLAPECVVTPTAGAHTYKLSMAQGAAGTVSVGGAATAPAFIIAELV
jgi:hypothetical protein